jgi:hypothetical protein
MPHESGHPSWQLLLRFILIAEPTPAREDAQRK